MDWLLVRGGRIVNHIFELSAVVLSDFRRFYI